MILATGFVAFNAGSQLHIDQDGDGHIIGLAAANTMLAGAGGMIAVAIVIYMYEIMANFNYETIRNYCCIF